MRVSWTVLPATLLFASSVTSLVYRTEDVTATFDDLKVASQAFDVNSIGRYRHLEWVGFNVAKQIGNPKDDDFTGVIVNSVPNYAGGMAEGNLFQITSSYPGSQVVLFDFTKFSWGCAVRGGQGEMAGWCSLDIYGFEPGAKLPTAHAVSFFWPKEGVKKMEMVVAKLPGSFRGVNNVLFRVQAENPIFYVDDVQYTTFNVTAIGNGVGELIHDSAALQGKEWPMMSVVKAEADAQPFIA